MGICTIGLFWAFSELIMHSMTFRKVCFGTNKKLFDHRFPASPPSSFYPPGHFLGLVFQCALRKASVSPGSCLPACQPGRGSQARTLVTDPGLEGLICMKGVLVKWVISGHRDFWLGLRIWNQSRLSSWRRAGLVRKTQCVEAETPGGLPMSHWEENNCEILTWLIWLRHPNTWIQLRLIFLIA